MLLDALSIYNILHVFNYTYMLFRYHILYHIYIVIYMNITVIIYILKWHPIKKKNKLFSLMKPIAEYFYVHYLCTCNNNSHFPVAICSLGLIIYIHMYWIRLLSIARAFEYWLLLQYVMVFEIQTAVTRPNFDTCPLPYLHVCIYVYMV